MHSIANLVPFLFPSGRSRTCSSVLTLPGIRAHSPLPYLEPVLPYSIVFDSLVNHPPGCLVPFLSLFLWSSPCGPLSVAYLMVLRI